MPAPALLSDQSEEDRDFAARCAALEIAQLEAEFDEGVARLRTNWEWLSTHWQPFKTIRDKRLAHLDTSKIGAQYQITTIAGPDWGTVKEAVRLLIETAELLLTLLHKKDESVAQSRELAKRDARDFWDVPASALGN